MTDTKGNSLVQNRAIQPSLLRCRRMLALLFDRVKRQVPARDGRDGSTSA